MLVFNCQNLNILNYYSLVYGSSPMIKLDDPSELSSHAMVEFAVAPLLHSEVVWLNERWCISQGVNPFNSIERNQLTKRLLADFAVRAKESTESVRKEHDLFLYADRYGGTGGSIHGGSGRCGSKNGLIAKGIGRTPLVSSEADIYHQNGLLSFSEAIKEIVCSEICRNELPWGAIPVVALIDCHDYHEAPFDGKPRRSAILIRPTFIRPAHFERSIFFGTGGRPGTEQYEDVIRVRTAIQGLVSCKMPHYSLKEIFERLAQQLGAMRALRLWPSRFLSSNVTIDGEIVDFGSFRVVAGWSVAVGMTGEYFGAEIFQIKRAFLSLAWYFSKYAPGALDGYDMRELLKRLECIEKEEFLSTCFRGLGISKIEGKSLEHIGDLLSAYYAEQQRTKVDAFNDNQLWLYSALVQRKTDVNVDCNSLEYKILNFLKSTKALDHGIQANNEETRAENFLKPRRGLKYEVIERKTLYLEKILPRAGSSSSGLVSDFLDRQITKNTLWCAALKEDTTVLASAITTYCSSYICRDVLSGNVFLRIKASYYDENVFIFGEKIDLSSIHDPVCNLQEGYIQFDIPCLEETKEFLIGGIEIRPPLRYYNRELVNG